MKNATTEVVCQLQGRGSITVVGFKVDIASALTQILQGCTLIFREISPCELKGKMGHYSSYHLS